MECPPATRALLTRRDARGMAGSMAGRPRGSSRVTEPRARRRVQVVVLGDFGRSPRMQFHALSLADQAHFEVDVVAYTGSTPRGEILAHPHIHLRLIPPPPAWLKRLPTALGLAVRVLLQLVQLTVLMLVRLKRPHFVLLQTPPCVPAFAVCRLVAFLRNATFIIDWHNMAYTLMGLSLGHGHFLVQAARGYEKVSIAFPKSRRLFDLTILTLFFNPRSSPDDGRTSTCKFSH